MVANPTQVVPQIYGERSGANEISEPPLNWIRTQSSRSSFQVTSCTQNNPWTSSITSRLTTFPTSEKHIFQPNEIHENSIYNYWIISIEELKHTLLTSLWLQLTHLQIRGCRIQIMTPENRMFYKRDKFGHFQNLMAYPYNTSHTVSITIFLFQHK